MFQLYEADVHGDFGLLPSGTLVTPPPLLRVTEYESPVVVAEVYVPLISVRKLPLALTAGEPSLTLMDPLPLTIYRPSNDAQKGTVQFLLLPLESTLLLPCSSEEHLYSSSLGWFWILYSKLRVTY